MSWIDFTTLYSAEAAIDLAAEQLHEPKNRWFGWSLANTTSTLLFDKSTEILIPPSSIETRRRLPKFLPRLKDRFPNSISDYKSPISDRDTALKMVIDYFSTDDLQVFLDALKGDNDFWGAPHVELNLPRFSGHIEKRGFDCSGRCVHGEAATSIRPCL